MGRCSVPDRESEELLCKDPGRGDALSARPAVSGTGGVLSAVMIAFKPLLDSVSTAAVVWIIAEGVCYITGAVFYSLNKKRYMHSVFHFFVLAGSICHIVAVWDVLIDYL